MIGYHKVVRTEQIPVGDGIVVHVEGREIALFRVDGRIYAIDNICPHRGGPLVEGQLTGSVISCPWHAWTFDVKSGKCTFAEGLCQQTFDVQVQEDDVWVKV